MSIKRTILNHRPNKYEGYWEVNYQAYRGADMWDNAWMGFVQYRSACARARRLVDDGVAVKTEVVLREGAPNEFVTLYVPMCTYEQAED